MTPWGPPREDPRAMRRTRWLVRIPLTSNRTRVGGPSPLPHYLKIPWKSRSLILGSSGQWLFVTSQWRVSESNDEGRGLRGLCLWGSQTAWRGGSRLGGHSQARWAREGLGALPVPSGPSTALALAALGWDLLWSSWWIILEAFPGKFGRSPSPAFMSRPQDEGAQDGSFLNHMSLSCTLAPLVPRRLCRRAHNMKQGPQCAVGGLGWEANPEVELLAFHPCKLETTTAKFSVRLPLALSSVCYIRGACNSTNYYKMNPM